MWTSNSIVSYLVLALLMTSAILLFLLGIQTFWQSLTGRDSRKTAQRLQTLIPPAAAQQKPVGLQPAGTVERTSLDKKLLRCPGGQHLERMLAQAGLRWTLNGLLLVCAASCVAGLSLSLLIHLAVLLDAGLAAFGLVLPLLYVQWRRQQRLQRIEAQLPDALDILARGLKAGQAFSASLQMACEELPQPLANEFQIVQEEVALGLSLHQALTNLSSRVPLTDMRYFVVALLIQRDSGGNLAEALDKLSHLIRDRFRLRAKVRVLSSEGRLSAWVLVILPFALAGLLSLFNPDFMTPLWQDPIGQAILKYMLALMAIGIIILRKIIRIRI